MATTVLDILKAQQKQGKPISFSLAVKTALKKPTPSPKRAPDTQIFKPKPSPKAAPKPVKAPTTPLPEAPIPTASPILLEKLLKKLPTSPESKVMAIKKIQQIQAVAASREQAKTMVSTSTTMSLGQFKQKHPDVIIPKSNYGSYDTVKVGYPVRDESGQLVPGYQFNYSPKSKHMIEVAGSTDNYKKYLNMVNNHPELVAIYNLSGGTGVGPLGIIPSMGVDLALASNKPGITGASERQELLIKYLHRVKGSPEGGPTVKGLGMAIIESPYVQLAAGEALAVGIPYAVKGGLRVAPRLIAKVPRGSAAIAKLISASGKLGGKSGQTIMQRQIPRNILRWAQEGARPAVQTTPRVIASSQTVRKLFSGTKATSYIDDVGNVILKGTNKPIGYLDDFNRVILYKPKRTLGFVERKFISPEQTKRYADLLKKGVTTEGDVIFRGKPGKNPWAEFQAMIEQSQYKQKWLRGVKHPYRSAELKIRYSDFPKYTPDEILLTESEAVKQAILKGKIPGREYGSLYNIQSKAYREFAEEFPELASKIPKEFLVSKQLPGGVTVSKRSLMNIDLSDVKQAQKLREILIKNRAWANYEPQVSTAVNKLNRLGLVTDQSGFIPTDPTKSFISIINKPNPIIRRVAAKHGIKIVPTPEDAVTFAKYSLEVKGNTLSAIKMKFDKFASALEKEMLKPKQNIWAKTGKQWNPFTQQFDDVGTASLLQQPSRRIISQEERAIIRQLTKGGDVFGKGVSRTLGPQFMIPVQRSGLEAFALFFGFRPMSSQKTKSDVFLTPQQQYNKAVAAMKKQEQYVKDLTDQQRKQIIKQENAMKQEQAMRQKQATIQAQALRQAMVAETAFERPLPRGKERAPPKKGEAIAYPPLIPPVWFPHMGGKVAGRGRADPYSVRYYNEYEALQALMRNVIF